MENLLSETAYKFKKTYGGTPETQTPQDAPRLRGPSLKIQIHLTQRAITESFRLASGINDTARR